MIVVLVVAAGAAWESSVLERVGARSGMVVLKRCVDVDELLATSSAGQADAAVVALEAPGLDAAAVEVLHRHHVRVVAVAGPGEGARARAARIGVDALVDHDELDRVPDALAAESEPTPAGLDPDLEAELDPEPGEAGRIIAVWGPAGAPGRTTVATSLATLLARRGHRTTLVDADPYGGSVAQQLGVLDEVSGLLSAARLTGEGALEAGFDGVQRALDARLTVVTGLPRGERWAEVRAGTVEHLLEVARGHGQVVVDTGFSLEDDPTGDVSARPGRNQLTLGALDVADEVVVVGTADPVGLARLARGLVDVRERQPAATVHVVVNRMRPSLGWSQREVAGIVEGFARVAGVHVLPDDRATADRALTRGSSVPDSAACDLVDALSAVAEAVVPPPTPHRDGSRPRFAVLRRRTTGRARRR